MEGECASGDCQYRSGIPLILPWRRAGPGSADCLPIIVRFDVIFLQQKEKSSTKACRTMEFYLSVPNIKNPCVRVAPFAKHQRTPRGVSRFVAQGGRSCAAALLQAKQPRLLTFACVWKRFCICGAPPPPHRTHCIHVVRVVFCLIFVSRQKLHPYHMRNIELCPKDLYSLFGSRLLCISTQIQLVCTRLLYSAQYSLHM